MNCAICCPLNVTSSGRVFFGSGTLEQGFSGNRPHSTASLSARLNVPAILRTYLFESSGVAPLRVELIRPPASKSLYNLAMSSGLSSRNVRSPIRGTRNARICCAVVSRVDGFIVREFLYVSYQAAKNTETVCLDASIERPLPSVTIAFAFAS